MQQLREITTQLMIVNEEIATTFSQYQNSQKLFCRSGCGECCLHPGIEASVLEMLPLALHLQEQGLAESTLEAMQQDDRTSCFFYKPSSADGKSGQCSIYQYRPAVCRMFGAAGYRGREGEVLLSVCKVIRSEQPEALIAAEQNIATEVPPMLRNGKEQIAQIDYQLSTKNMPIKQAAEAALDKVLTKAYYASFAEPAASGLIEPVLAALVQPVLDNLVQPVLDGLVQPVFDGLVDGISSARASVELLAGAVTGETVLSSDAGFGS